MYDSIDSTNVLFAALGKAPWLLAMVWLFVAFFSTANSAKSDLQQLAFPKISDCLG